MLEGIHQLAFRSVTGGREGGREGKGGGGEGREGGWGWAGGREFPCATVGGSPWAWLSGWKGKRNDFCFTQIWVYCMLNLPLIDGHVFCRSGLSNSLYCPTHNLSKFTSDDVSLVTRGDQDRRARVMTLWQILGRK